MAIVWTWSWTGAAASPRVRGRPARWLGRRAGLLDVGTQDLPQQLLLRADVVVERPPLDPRPQTDLRHARGMEALLREELHGDAQDSLAGRGALLCAARRAPRTALHRCGRTWRRRRGSSVGRLSRLYARHCLQNIDRSVNMRACPLILLGFDATCGAPGVAIRARRGGAPGGDRPPNALRPAIRALRQDRARHRR